MINKDKVSYCKNKKLNFLPLLQKLINNAVILLSDHIITCTILKYYLLMFLRAETGVRDN